MRQRVGVFSVVNYDLFYKIEDELGEVSDFKIIDRADGFIINYNSNGVGKQMVFNDKSKKILLQCLIYFAYDSLQVKAAV